MVSKYIQPIQSLVLVLESTIFLLKFGWFFLQQEIIRKETCQRSKEKRKSRFKKTKLDKEALIWIKQETQKDAS